MIDMSLCYIYIYIYTYQHHPKGGFYTPLTIYVPSSNHPVGGGDGGGI